MGNNRNGVFMSNAWDNLRAIVEKTNQGQNPAPSFQVPQVFKAPGRFEQIQAVAESEMGEYAQYAEIHRIVDLPVDMGIEPFTDETKAYLAKSGNPAKPFSEEFTQHFWAMGVCPYTYDFEMFCRGHLLAEAFNTGFRLYPTQVNSIRAYELSGGLIGAIGVGWGKTLMFYAIAAAAYQKGLRKIIYLVPPNVYDQNSEHDLRWARTKIPIPYAVHKLGGKGIKARRNLAKADRPGLYIMPQSQLSTVDAEELLHEIDPDLMLIDEVHNLKHQGSARTKRMVRFAERRKPELACASGTITSKSIKDYHHLSSLALGVSSPLPLANHLATEWSVVLDSDADEEGKATGPLMPLIAWAQRTFPNEPITNDRSGFRKAFKLRLNSVPGVVSSGDADIGVSLTMTNRPVENHENYQNWDVLQSLMQQVDEEWITPNGDPIDHRIHTWKWLHELTAGFYNQLTWPSAQEYAERTKTSVEQAADILGRAAEHHAAKSNYHSILAKWLRESHTPGMDTPFLVGMEMARNGGDNVPEEVYGAWDRARQLDFEGRPDRDSTAIRVCDYKVNDACIWAAKELPKGKGGIIWVYHNAIGEWIYDYLVHYGINALHCPAGPAHNAAIADPANGDKVIVASITAHGEGKNLQHFQHQYVAQWPRPATKAEQMLGRMHRNGQQADELIVRTNMTVAWDDMNFGACLNDALYIQQTTGNRQKLVYAGYDPLPVIFSSAFLMERGLEVHRLNEKQEMLLQEKFGA